MANMSNYLENEILDHLLGAATFTAPATVYVGLWTTTLDDTSTGATAGEASGGSYARVAVTNNLTNWPAASGGSKSNGTAITFPTATADWGVVTHVAILDAASTGNILFWVALTASRNITNGTTASFDVAAFSLTAN